MAKGKKSADYGEKKVKMVEEMKNYKSNKVKNYRDDECIKRILKTLQVPQEDLSNFRDLFNKLQAAKENPFDIDLYKSSDTLSTNIIRSPYIATAVEIFARGLNFPKTITVESKDRYSKEGKTAEAKVKALLEWCIRESKLENRYGEAKEDWAAYGDAYFRFFLKKAPKRKGRASGKVGKKSKYLCCEDVLGRNLLLDTAKSYVNSESIAKSSNFFAVTEFYTDQDLKARFGEWILEYVECGSHVDHDGYAEVMLSGNEYKKNATLYENDRGQKINPIYKYYEVVEYQNRSDEVESITIGANAFPVTLYEEGGDRIPPKSLAPHVDWGDEYLHRNSYGEAVLNLHNIYFYFNKESIRNRGLAQKLYAAQVAHEIVENAKLDSTRKRMYEIPYVIGVNADEMAEIQAKHQKRYKENVFTVMPIPKTIGANILPEMGTLKFEGIRPDEARQSTEDNYRLAKDLSGVSLDRLEIQQGVGVGQSEMLEEEKIQSVEYIVEKNIENIIGLLVGVLDFTINHEGFDCEQEISYDTYNENLEITGQTKKMVKDVTKDLYDFEFKVFIDRNELVKKSQVVIVQKLIDFLGTIDPQAIPEAAKAIFARIADAMRLDIPLSALKGIENSMPQGGKSQFKSGGAPATEGGGASALESFMNKTNATPKNTGNAQPLPAPQAIQ